MRILITGASGFVGQALCKQAKRQNFDVRGALRKDNNLPLDVETITVGEINASTDWTNALLNVDVVIHLAARVHMMKDHSADPLAEFRKVNVQGTENLALQAARAGVKRLVFVSSIKVNGETTSGNTIYSETDSPAPQDPYAVSKYEAEQALQRIAQNTGLEIVILRPPLVYGPGVKGNFAQMLKVLKKGIPLPFASIRNRLSLIYVENLVAALLVCATHPAAAGQTYLVSDGLEISTPDLLNRLGSAMNHPARLFPCPPAFLKLAGHLIGKSNQIERLLGSLRIDSGKIRRELNWSPPRSLEEGLNITGTLFRNYKS